MFLGSDDDSGAVGSAAGPSEWWLGDWLTAGKLRS
ncbi:hypothetical protein F3Y22_tig00110201pilonHSYRG00365 [Hibiscus syriacus]|uniref:Uncharacterized protein n=1 Tax=Hibiscus syriacus TaxID=106335 RepID=A0A6A3BC65_HIBSY|nr:hypothetical protein F3Y22_tig00110627pilonHSYRG00007 [Hibiscus syriacus]KAE8714153.1 hypothetical protein F3Y22_tig00110201pilonHSYRG00365 [Hibiscus syriacus]